MLKIIFQTIYQMKMDSHEDPSMEVAEIVLNAVLELLSFHPELVNDPEVKEIVEQIRRDFLSKLGDK